MKITRFRDIPQFTRQGNYQVDFLMDHLVKFIEKEEKENDLQINPDFQRGNVWTEQQQVD